ncbi:MAG TPA: putative zinc-binding metallopeptidase [Kofleriaceae bacterium]|nr:putative zinc-binding metallopeptidase [Kofleriaceae bacterium]
MAVDSELVDWFHRTRGIPSGPELFDVGKPARHAHLNQLGRDLRWLGIRVRLHFVWTAQSSGVEEGAPSVVQLRRTLVRADDAPAAVHAAAERVLGLGVDDVARHEVGHALLFQRPSIARQPEFRRLFGDIDAAYRVGDPVDEVIHRMTSCGGLDNPRYRRVVSLYAATHPHERFAEAVRIALGCRADEGKLRAWADRHRTAPIVVEQLLWTGQWLRSYGRRLE